MSRNGRNCRRQKKNFYNLSFEKNKIVWIISFFIFIDTFICFKVFISFNSNKVVNADVSSIENVFSDNSSTDENIVTNSDLLFEKDEDFDYDSYYANKSRSFTLCAIGDFMYHNTQYFDAYL